MGDYHFPSHHALLHRRVWAFWDTKGISEYIPQKFGKFVLARLLRFGEHLLDEGITRKRKDV